jgi:hypothetical protein
MPRPRPGPSVLAVAFARTREQEDRDAVGGQEHRHLRGRRVDRRPGGRTFAREGARVFLAGRTRDKLEAVAADTTAAGGQAEVAEVDALDEQAVDQHADAVAAKAGSLDISFNLITRGDVQGTPLVDMTTADFVGPITTWGHGHLHHRAAIVRWALGASRLPAFQPTR